MYGIGAPVRRKEDFRFLTGRGRFTADLELPGQLHLVVHRAPVAHARIVSIDTAAARAAPGVVAVLTSDALRRAGVRSMPCAWPMVSRDGRPMAEPDRPVLATGKVVYAGQPVAAVIAESRLLARDAAELIAVDYAELPAVAGSVTAIAPGAPLVWDEIPGNRAFDWEIGDAAAVERAFAGAAHVVTLDLVQNRLVPNALEPRAAIGDYDAGRDEYTLYLANQNPHLARYLTCRNTLDIPEHKLRVVSGDIGGGFGSKGFQYAEDILVICAARELGRPVKWVGERSEAFLSDAQGRDHVTQAAMALDAGGRIVGLRSSVLANLGGFLSTWSAAIPTIFHATMLSGVYAIPAIHARIQGIFTNTVPTDAYRGAGRPEATYTVERLIEVAARETGIDAIELRRRNFIPKDAFPYTTPLGLVYDSGDYARCLDVTLQAADFGGFAARRDESRTRGRLRGIGVCVYVEVAGPGPSAGAIAMGSQMPFYEVATVRVHPDASVTVLTGAHSHGQGHETTFAQIVVEHLGVAFENIEIVHGDTARIPFGVGTFGSRSISVGGSAVLKAVDKVVAKARVIAAHMFEAAPEDVEFTGGVFRVAGTDQTIAFRDVAHMAYLPGNFPLDELEPGLEETACYDPPNFTFPSGCHCCELEIDPETGATAIVRYTVGDDFGVLINPLVVDGQVHGGLAQGIGQALMENTVYDAATAQLITGSFVDYCLPRAADLPMFTVEAVPGHSPSNPLGAKGCGEAGAIGAPAAVMNAVLDALRPVGVLDLDMPATPYRIWAAIAQARG